MSGEDFERRQAQHAWAVSAAVSSAAAVIACTALCAHDVAVSVGLHVACTRDDTPQISLSTICTWLPTWDSAIAQLIISGILLALIVTIRVLRPLHPVWCGAALLVGLCGFIYLTADFDVGGTAPGTPVQLWWLTQAATRGRTAILWLVATTCLSLAPLQLWPRM